MINYKAKGVALGTTATILVLIDLWPILHRSSVAKQSNTSPVEFSLSPKQNPTDLSKGIAWIRVKNRTNRTITLYAVCHPCIGLLVPSGVRKPLTYEGDPTVSNALFEPLGAHSFRDERVFVGDLMKGSLNPSHVGTCRCQLTYDDELVNGIAKSENWGKESQAGRVLGPLIT